MVKAKKNKTFEYFVEPVGSWDNANHGDFANAFEIDASMQKIPDKTGFSHGVYCIQFESIRHIIKYRKDTGFKCKIWYREQGTFAINEYGEDRYAR